MNSSSLILIVDDHPPGRKALAGLLEPEGYRLAFAADGEEALHSARTLAPDLVLLDVMMPHMDGFEVCRHLRADPATALMPVVLLTSLDDHESRLHGLEAGADDFVSKPFNRYELRARVRTITRLNRYRVLLDEQRRADSARRQLLWAITHGPDGYLLLDDAERPLYGNAQAWRYLNAAPDGQGRCAEPFPALARRHYRLEPADSWVHWPAADAHPRYLVRPESAAPALWIQVEQLDLPGAAGERLVRLRDVSESIGAQRHLWTFHSFVSHKLRTPLTSVVAGVGLLKRAVGGQIPEELEMLIDKAYDGSVRLKGAIDDVFRYIETPASVLRGGGCALLDLPPMLARIADELGVARLGVTCDLPAPRRLSLNTPTIELLLTELLENSAKFHPAHDPSVTVTIALCAENALISVTDDGLHLPAEELAQIGRPYHQVDLEFTGQVPGMGLGLATVNRVCWSAGGSCRIANRTDGPGVEVTLELPLAGEENLANFTG